MQRVARGHHVGPSPEPGQGPFFVAKKSEDNWKHQCFYKCYNFLDSKCFLKNSFQPLCTSGGRLRSWAGTGKGRGWTGRMMVYGCQEPNNPCNGAAFSSRDCFPRKTARVIKIWTSLPTPTLKPWLLHVGSLPCTTENKL